LIALSISLGLTLASSSWAALPINVIFKENRTSMDGTPFQLYRVECSNGQLQALTAWNNRTLWCPQYKLVESACSNQQLESAKVACEADLLASS
jgi:hypothetical protein